MARRMGIGGNTLIASALCLCMVAFSFSANAAAKNEFIFRVFWDQGSIMRTPDYFKELITRAAANGYNAIIAPDWDHQIIEHKPKAYFDKYRDVKAHAKRKGIELAPWIMWQGFPAYKNYNLSESFPVKGTKFKVVNGEARAFGDHNVDLKNGGFESGVSNWGMGGLGGSWSIDKSTKKSGTASLLIRNAPKGSRLTQNIKLKPHRAYEISAWFKTSGIKYAGSIAFFVDPHLLARKDRPFGTPIQRPDGSKGGYWSKLSPNMNWTKCVIDFNSLKETHATLTLYLAPAKAQGGNIWIDNIEVREVGLYETVRGDKRPVVVKNAKGSVTYEEGKDYAVDPKCNTMTLDTYWYEGHLKIPQGSAIQNQQELRVDWFQFANVRTMVAASDFCLPETWTTLQKNVRRVDDLMGNANAAYMKYSEYRLGGWNQDCECFRFKTGGEYLTKVLEGSECVLRSVSNGCRTIFSENDMYDPYFNGYNGPYATWFGEGPRKQSPYGIYGGTYGSYKGLGHDIVIINWNTPFGQAYTDSSLMFFAGKDPKYPDVKNRQLLQCLGSGDASRWCNTLDRLEPKGLEGISGVSFTDWYYGTYAHMGAVANAFKARGRWGTNPFPSKTCAPLAQCDGFNPTNISRPTKQASEDYSLAPLKTIPISSTVLAVHYSVSQYKRISLKVFDLLGREVQTLFSGRKAIGSHRTIWNASTLPAGMYLLHLTVDGVGQLISKQMLF